LILWLFPLGAAWWHASGSRSVAPRWYWLDESEKPLLVSGESATHVKKAATLGVVGGLLFALLFFAARVTFGPNAAALEQDDAYQMFLIVEVLAALAAQLLIAVV